MARTAIHCIIHGKVQGVWYRAWTQQTAASKSLDGWVRNLPDGTVEAVFAGEETAVADMLEACRKGPPLSRVTGIDQEPAEDPGTAGFEVR
ncbi:MAG: acylphosphatase [Alphaproteobacteria bacterium]